MARRIVVTGVGMITPLGHGVKPNWDRLIRGESGIDRITLFNASHFPTKIAGEVKGLDFARWEKQDERLRFAGRNTRFAILATEEAMRDSGLNQGAAIPRERIGIYMGAGDGGSDFKNFTRAVIQCLSNEGNPQIGVVDKDRYLNDTTSFFNSYIEFEQEPCVVVGHMARLFDVEGPCANCLTACAASSQAIGEATEIIRRGDADVMIAGGTHSMIHPFGVAGFNLLTALSTQNAEPKRASRPFDLKRDGFILSEGSGVVIMEELEHAKRRGARIYGEIAGYGSTADAYRLTDTHPEGRGAIQALQLALHNSGVQPEEVGYINAHGTSTVVNDRIESKAIKEVFGSRAYSIPVSSIKSMMGHLIAAAGAVELITCLYVIREGIIPPTINYEEPDPECDLDYVPNKAREKKVNVSLSNSFGFGGQNVTLVIKKFEG